MNHFNMSENSWGYIPEWEGYYQASTNGAIRSVDRLTASRPAKGKILKPSLQNSGYLIVGLCRGKKTKTILVHRAVALTFIPNPEGKKYVNHKDGNKLNNSVSNLEWCTFSENIQHSYDNGSRVISDRHKEGLIAFNKETKSKIVYQYDSSGNFVKAYTSAVEASKETGANYGSIRQCVNGSPKYRQAGGFVWLAAPLPKDKYLK